MKAMLLCLFFVASCLCGRAVAQVPDPPLVENGDWWAGTEVAAGVSAQNTTAPGFTVFNVANQANLLGDDQPFTLAATGIQADSRGTPTSRGPVVCEVRDVRGQVIGAEFLYEGSALWYHAVPYGLVLELDPRTGTLLQLTSYWDDSGHSLQFQEATDGYGITYLSYRGLPSGPMGDHWYTYLLIKDEQDSMGRWHLVRKWEESKTLLAVAPARTEHVGIETSSGTLASFYFWSSVGGDEAVIQVARAPNWDFSLPNRYQADIGWLPTLPGGSILQHADVELTEVPGSESLLLWRIGSRSSQNATLPRTFPFGWTDGWVWSQSAYFLYETGSFPDVPTLHWAYDGIEACSDAGIVGGYPDGTYGPSLAVTRDQMAVYIARALVSPSGDAGVPDFTDTPTFPDVPTGNWALKYVEFAVDQAVVTGYDDGNYHPEYTVDRAQMAVYVARAMVAPSGEAGLADYVPSDPRNFADVPDDFWSYKHIEYCVEQGVVNGYEDGMYHPEIVVTRDQMAVYVARAFGL